jgi:transcriptional regulator GlxA family with amidase domain
MNHYTTDNPVTLERLLDRTSGWLPPALRRAVRYASARVSEPISLDDVVSAAGISKQHFCALASQAFGMGFMRVLQHCQVARAKELFDTTNRSVTEVCYDPSVGFQNLRQFRRAFRRSYGCTPSEYRRWASERRVERLGMYHHMSHRCQEENCARSLSVGLG